MKEKIIICPECNSTTDPVWAPAKKSAPSLAAKFIESEGMCMECFKKSKGLVKIEDHYVPWSYRNWADSPKKRSADDAEDINADLPEITYCKEHKKWKLEFTGADSGGYDVQLFTWYFDDLNSIFLKMNKGGT